MSEEGTNTLMIFVAGLALLALLVFIAMGLMGMIELPDPTKFVTKESFPTVLEGEPIGTFMFTDLNNDKDHTTSTEVACGIARSIRKDFLQYGYGKGRPEAGGDYKILKPIAKKKTIVGRGAFRIQWNEDGKNFWTYEDISEILQEDLMSKCTNDQAWSCSTPYLDEECISNALGHLKVSEDAEDYMCTKKTGQEVKINAGGALVSFGNDECGKNSQIADGEDNCVRFCPGGDRIRQWSAPGDDGITEYIDDQDQDKKNDWPPFQCLTGNSIEAGSCEPLYSWVLIWNKDKNKYEIDIARMAEPIDMGETATSAVVGKLLDGKYKHRDIKSSYPFPELRTRYDITFKPTDDVTLANMLTQFTNGLNEGADHKDWDVAIEECFGDECYESTAVKKTWRAVKEKAIKWVGIPGVPDEFDQSKDDSKTRKKLKTVVVRTNIENTNELLNSNHTYRVVMRWWRVTINTEWKEPGCSGYGVDCVACLESNGAYIGQRWALDCQREPDDMGGYWDIKKPTRYQDQTLIIVDQGEEGTWGSAVG